MFPKWKRQTAMLAFVLMAMTTFGMKNGNEKDPKGLENAMRPIHLDSQSICTGQNPYNHCDQDNKQDEENVKLESARIFNGDNISGDYSMESELENKEGNQTNQNSLLSTAGDNYVMLSTIPSLTIESKDPLSTIPSLTTKSNDSFSTMSPLLTESDDPESNDPVTEKFLVLHELPMLLKNKLYELKVQELEAEIIKKNEKLKEYEEVKKESKNASGTYKRSSIISQHYPAYKKSSIIYHNKPSIPFRNLRSTMISHDNSRVVSEDKSNIITHDKSNTLFHDNSRVDSKNNSNIISHDKSNITSCNVRSTIISHDNSRVDSEDKSNIILSSVDKSSTILHDNSIVDSKDSSNTVSHDKSNITSRNLRSTIISHDNSRVDSEEKSDITSHDKSNTTSYDGMLEYIEKLEKETRKSFGTYDKSNTNADIKTSNQPTLTPNSYIQTMDPYQQQDQINHQLYQQQCQLQYNQNIYCHQLYQQQCLHQQPYQCQLYYQNLPCSHQQPYQSCYECHRQQQIQPVMDAQNNITHSNYFTERKQPNSLVPVRMSYLEEMELTKRLQLTRLNNDSSSDSDVERGDKKK